MRAKQKVICCLALLVSLSARPATAGEVMPLITRRVVEFVNPGNLAGFTGANQRRKVTVITNELGQANLRCEMIRSESDTATGGCHAEAHLARFPDGQRFGPFPGFRRIIRYGVKFDANCESANVAFFQIKNNQGANQWDHLVALWRPGGRQGDRIMLQSNPFGAPSRLLYAWPSHDGVTPLLSGRWHAIRVTGYFTTSTNGWLTVNCDGRDVTWYEDRDCTRKVGVLVRGPVLAEIPDSQWQLQLGGYAYFNRQGAARAYDFIHDISVESWE